MADRQITCIHYLRPYDTYHQFLLIIMNISICMCLSVLYLWYTTTYKCIPTSQARLIFTPTLQPWITNAVEIDVFITTPTRWKSALKVWKYYAHTASHSVSQSPAPVLGGQTAVYAQGRYLPCTKIAVSPPKTGTGGWLTEWLAVWA